MRHLAAEEHPVVLRRIVAIAPLGDRNRSVEIARLMGERLGVLVVGSGAPVQRVLPVEHRAAEKEEGGRQDAGQPATGSHRFLSENDAAEADRGEQEEQPFVVIGKEIRRHQRNSSPPARRRGRRRRRRTTSRDRTRSGVADSPGDAGRARHAPSSRRGT